MPQQRNVQHRARLRAPKWKGHLRAAGRDDRCNAGSVRRRARRDEQRRGRGRAVRGDCAGSVSRQRFVSVGLLRDDWLLRPQRQLHRQLHALGLREQREMRRRRSVLRRSHDRRCRCVPSRRRVDARGVPRGPELLARSEAPLHEQHRLSEEHADLRHDPRRGDEHAHRRLPVMDEMSEVRTGFEPIYEGVASLCLASWLPHRMHWFD